TVSVQTLSTTHDLGKVELIRRITLWLTEPEK
ncbi:MAG: hypothetical protein ACI9P7_001229, partial [Candidatus Azotimanducaceae bacterium]